MTFIGLVVAILVIAIIVGLVQRYAPVDPAFKQMILIIGIIICLVFVLEAFGLLNFLRVQVPHV